MHTTHRTVVLSFFVAMLGFLSQSAQAGIIQGASGTPNPITAGNMYTLTVTGSNSGGFLCQGLNIDWGDGESSTPTGGLAFPYVTTHLYGPVASPTVRTISITPGGSECAGSATTTVTVNPAPGVISTITGPATGTAGTPISITVSGAGFCGSMNVNWGDGTETVNNYNLGSPTPISHTYGSPGPKTITVTGTASCSGAATHNLTVSDPPGVISTVIGAATATQNAPYSITVSGTGSCGAMSINWGDGGSPETVNNYNLSSPVARSHNYMTVGSKTITVTGTNNCSGTSTHDVMVNPPPSGPGVISAINGPSTVYRNVTSNWTVTGTGICGSMTLNWGDGSLPASVPTYNLVSPANLPHQYTTVGTKTITVAGNSSCTGNASLIVNVTNFIPPRWLDVVLSRLQNRFRYRVPCLGTPCPFPPGPGPGPCLSCPRILDQIKREDMSRTQVLAEAKMIVDRVSAGKLRAPIEIHHAQARLTQLAMALEESDRRRADLLKSFDAEAAKTRLKVAPATKLQQMPVKQIREKRLQAN